MVKNAFLNLICEVICISEKNNSVVFKETLFVGIWVLIFSAIMQAVFLIIGKWDYTVLLGNLISAAVGIFNFYLLCRTVEKALSSGDVKKAKSIIKLSQFARLVMMGIVAALGALLSCFHLWGTIIPLLFPRLTLIIRQIMLKKQQRGTTNE